MKKQDKYDCRKIKEMIMNNDLSISALSESHLNTLIAYEAECLMASKTEYDTTFMDMCCAALEALQQSTFPSDEKIAEIGEKAYQEYINSNDYTKAFDTQKTKIFPARKPIRILIVTALLLAALTITVMAVWNPFSNWIRNIKDSFNLNLGDVMENEHGSLSSDKTTQKFSSVDEMEKTTGIHFDLLDEISAVPDYIDISQHGKKKIVNMQYQLDAKQIALTIYLENAPYYQESMEQANLQKQTLGNLEWYIATYVNNHQTIVAFDGNYVYAITADSLDTITTLMKGN